MRLIRRAIARALLRNSISNARAELKDWWTRTDANALQLVHTMNHLSDLRLRLAALGPAPEGEVRHG